MSRGDWNGYAPKVVWRRFILIGLSSSLFASAQRVTSSAEPKPTPPPAPWRLSAALSTPPWLRLSATHRSRYEHLENQFRVGFPGDESAFVLFTTASLELDFSPLTLGVELSDSRAYLTSDRAAQDTTVVNPLELLQLYLEAQLSNVLREGDQVRARIGRITMDVGSRRLVARNRFRNTINGFMGIDLEWLIVGGSQVRLFGTLPVRRLATSTRAPEENHIEFDQESFDRILWGAHFFRKNNPGRLDTEAYLLGLHESEQADIPTRQLLTTGIRLLRPPEPDEADLELEFAGQFGQISSPGEPQTSVDLEHSAFFVHAALGYTLELPWSPRGVLQYDFASGDDHPEDQRSGRFDTLFGARRFELGPTSLYGAFARSNINSPGARLEIQPHRKVDAFFSYRPFWLASTRDAWTTSGIRDPEGTSGSFIGQQIEARLRLHLFPGNVDLELGFAHTFLGRFPRSAPNTQSEGNPSYVYVQAGFEI